MKRSMFGLISATMLVVSSLHAEEISIMTVRDLVYSSVFRGDMRAYIAGVLDGQKWTAFMLDRKPTDRACPGADVSLSQMQDLVRKAVSRWSTDNYEKSAAGAVIAILASEYPCK